MPAVPYPDTVRFNPAPGNQLDFDRRLLAGALEREMPVLGICYGMQLIALHFDGRLIYDIPHDRPEAGCHQLPEATGRHPLVVEPDSALCRILGPDPGPVNSLHHQGLSEPGGGLRVGARADDGLIEAVEATEHGFCIGVQWHPEQMTGPHREALFSAFVTACAHR
jgi:putative glutamine amidotransferase